MVCDRRVQIDCLGDEVAPLNLDGSLILSPAAQAAGICGIPDVASVSFRFFDVANGGGQQNIMQKSPEYSGNTAKLFRLQGIDVFGIATGIGKTAALSDGDCHGAAFADEETLRADMDKACKIAQAAGAKTIRVFSFYVPDGDTLTERCQPSGDLFAIAVKYLKIMAEIAEKYGILLLLENEGFLVGWKGKIVLELIKQVASKFLKAVYDVGNALNVGLTHREILAEVKALIEADALGGLHLKELELPEEIAARVQGGELMTEAQIAMHHVPAGTGDGNFAAVLRLVAENIERLNEMLGGIVKGLIFTLTIEGHLLKGGQFSGNSSPRGVAKIVEVITSLLRQVGLAYDTASLEELKKARAQLL